MRAAIVWIGSALGFLLSWPMLAASTNPSGNKITVSLYDFAHIRPQTLTQAERVATDVFAMAGIDVYWTTELAENSHQFISDFSGAGGAECPGLLASAIVPVRILPQAPPGLAPQALGYSLPCAKLGVLVTIYADRVRMVSGYMRTTFDRVLGYTFTHELGHVFLRSLTHEKNGLMKGVWSKKDWQRAAVMNVPFTSFNPHA